MLKTFLATGLCALAFATTTEAQTLLAGWTFDTLPVAPGTGSTQVANFGTGTIFLDGTNGSSTWITATTGNQVTAFAGSLLNDPRPGLVAGTATAGQSLALLNTTANGFSIVIGVSTTGFENISLSFASQRSGTGFNNNTFAFSLDGTNFTPFGSTVAPGTSFAAITQALPVEVANAPSVFIRYTVTGASSAAGNNRLDNIVITGTPIPEPSTIALGLVGLAGMVALRRRK
ncbi:MAG: PEP-CTERM sorting domain-containing protein [Verrucomicrobia bacterium]|nr:PEP-CTERM sorting domain-containing protein [Verrucomicrobiota bacterium]